MRVTVQRKNFFLNIGLNEIQTSVINIGSENHDLLMFGIIIYIYITPIFVVEFIFLLEILYARNELSICIKLNGKHVHANK